MFEGFSSPFLEPIHFQAGWPYGQTKLLLPGAATGFSIMESGTIGLQEIRTESYTLHYYTFSFHRKSTLLLSEESGLRSWFSMKGGIGLGRNEKCCQTLAQGQYTWLNPAERKMKIIVPGEKECQIMSIHLRDSKGAGWVALFPCFEQQPKDASTSSLFCLPAPRPVWDAFYEIPQLHYPPELQKVYLELKLQQILFAQLAQTYKEEPRQRLSPLEKEMAQRAHDIIVLDIREHYPNDKLARLVGYSESSLKRAFRKEFGMGLYQYLRRVRMLKAQELLLKGEQVKVVAPTVGMRPGNFTMEFQKYFGYKATSLYKHNRG
ncbi:MAG: transcriptional regulator, AraC family [Flaviaesturariibacter sp.]|nr:transcriptional regulator, AraC family [Flaviaesturariibacter sp.]